MRSPGFEQFAPCDYAHRIGKRRSREEEIAFFEAVSQGVDQKRNASLELLDRGGWDFFLSALAETHCVGHQLWHLHDPSSAHHDPALVRRLGGDPVRTIYRMLDSVVADHLTRLEHSYGKASFDAEALHENFAALIEALVKNKPSAAKGQYLKTIFLSSTMGPSVPVDVREAGKLTTG